MDFGVWQNEAPPLTNKLNLHNLLDFPEPNFCISKLGIKILPTLYHFCEIDIIPTKFIELYLTHDNFSINVYHCFHYFVLLLFKQGSLDLALTSVRISYIVL